MTELGERLQDMATRYGLRDVYVFGSRAQAIATRAGGSQAQGSQAVDAAEGRDADIGVEPLSAGGLDPQARVRLTADLEDLLAAPRVDLVVLSEAPTLLALEVVKGELLFTADPRAQAEHELYIMRRAADLAPFHRERVRQVLEEGAR
ncbi:MAG: nucleotidyltransferase domain-containing protein [Gemmatimonadota bacterium]